MFGVIKLEIVTSHYMARSADTPPGCVRATCNLRIGGHITGCDWHPRQVLIRDGDLDVPGKRVDAGGLDLRLRGPRQHGTAEIRT